MKSSKNRLFAGAISCILPLLFWTLILTASTAAERVQNMGKAAGISLSTEIKNADNPFLPFLKNTMPPQIIDALDTQVLSDGIQVSKIRFQSLINPGDTNLVYALAIFPKLRKNNPAMLLLHGGTQNADTYLNLGLEYARRGYICLIPDLPGIASPEGVLRNGEGSKGKWTNVAYGSHHFTVEPEIQNSSIFEGVVTCIQSFYLLKSFSGVDVKNIGIRGLSWGGYSAVMTTALLGSLVKAGLSVYGSGFYDLPSYFQPILNGMDSISRGKWLNSLDAGRYADQIKVPFFFMAASNDTYFHAPAVMATFDQIKGTKNILFAPNNDHNLSNLANADSTEFTFFDFYLKQQGHGIPELVISSVKNQADGSQQILFKTENQVKEVTLWYSSGETDWMKKTWKSSSAIQIKGNRYRAILPKEVVENTGCWYLIATDKNKASNGTKSQ